ncbi:MAG: adenosylmethionine--8-amino-7-oxononanoate transaminase [Breznakibacter sp.]
MNDQLLHFDRHHIWHPYTSAIDPLPVYPVESAQGCTIRLTDGRELTDGMSSWWAAVHGYNHPVLNKAMAGQLAQMSHIMFGGFTHRPAVQLAEKLVLLTPEPLQWVFFCDSGSVAVEVAMKMALQYQQSLGKTERKKFAALRGGYHGDTWHAMSVCDPVTGMHSLFAGGLPIQYFIDRPQSRFGRPLCDTDRQQLFAFFDRYAGELAAFVVEPIVQGAGGMWFYSSDYLQLLSRLCQQHDVLLIADEIATGFGRTGKLFACEHAQVLPDIMCLGKAITGGYMSFAATMATNRIAETVSRGDAGVFMHGPTFMGNPLACAVANASIGLLLENDWAQQVQRIQRNLEQGLEPCSRLSNVADVRCLGAIGVVELTKPIDMGAIQKLFVGRGVWVRPFGRLVYLMPPFVATDNELEKLTSAVCHVVAQVE